MLEDFNNGTLNKYYKASAFPSLEKSPVPRWDLVEAKDYASFTIQTGRGCPYDCDFCSVRLFNGEKYRHKSIKQVINELKVLVKIDPKKTIFFADDNLLAIPTYAEELFKEIKKIGVKKWWCQASVNRLKNKRLLKLMYEAGCEAVFAGFESVSQESLKSLKKASVNIADEYRRVIDLVHENGIGIFGSFMLGSDADTSTIFEDTKQFINQTNIAFAMLNYLTPTPGSSFYGSLAKEDRILDSRWERYNGEFVCFKPSNMRPEELEKQRMKLLNDIYSYDSLYERLNSLWSKGVFVRDQRQGKKLFTRGRILFSLSAILRNGKERNFILKSLWNRKVTSVGAISLGVSFHEYAKRDYLNDQRKR